MAEAQAQAQHIEDSGTLQELWLGEVKRIGTLLLFSPVDSVAVDFKGRWWLLLSPGGFRSLLRWLGVTLFEIEGPYLLIALRRSSQYWDRNNKCVK